MLYIGNEEVLGRSEETLLLGMLPSMVLFSSGIVPLMTYLFNYIDLFFSLCHGFIRMIAIIQEK